MFFIFEYIIFLNLKELRDVPLLNKLAVAHFKFVDVVVLIIVGENVLALNHFNFIEGCCPGGSLLADSSNYIKAGTCSVGLAHKDVLTAIANVEVVIVMGDTPTFTNYSWQRNLFFNDRIERRVEIFEDY